MKTSKNDKPVLMFTDNAKIETLYNSATGISDKLNHALIEAEQLLSTSFNDDEATEVLEKGFNHVMDLLRKQFQFPNATDEFNLTSMGKSIDQAKKALSASGSNFNAYGFIVKDGKVILSEEGKNEIQESAKFYTENHCQNEAFELSKILARNLNLALTKGLIENGETDRMNNMLKIVKREGNGFTPNHTVINRITENGQFRSMY
ncbi:hypothetical protein GH721_16240 [Kriegella sp. EG-1]|nr:hypothetical protein [Flavobacteriaceae bacterium EG-1]